MITRHLHSKGKCDLTHNLDRQFHLHHSQLPKPGSQSKRLQYARKWLLDLPNGSAAPQSFCPMMMKTCWNYPLPNPRPRQLVCSAKSHLMAGHHWTCHLPNQPKPRAPSLDVLLPNPLPRLLRPRLGRTPRLQRNRQSQNHCIPFSRKLRRNNDGGRGPRRQM